MILGRRERPVPSTDAITGDHESRCLIYAGDGVPRALKDPSEISDLLREQQNFVWFDLTEPTAADLEVLREEFALHPTAVEDAALVHERPKIESYGDYWLVVLHAATLDGGVLDLHEIAIFVGKNFLVSIRAHPAYPLGEIERRWRAKDAIPHSPAGLLYLFLDVVVDGYNPVAAAYDERLVAIENRVLSKERGASAQPVLRDILTFKRDLVQLRHAVAPVRDILGPPLRGELSLDPAMMAYFRDVHDHALRVTEQIDSIRELLNSTLDVHLSTEAHRQSEVSKQLTIIATIFLPLTYITGFFGQNFGWMVNHIDKPWDFVTIGIGSQVLAVILLVVFFKRRGWF